MEIKTLEQATNGAMVNHMYGCENKKYYVSFYINSGEREERFGCSKSVLGVIEHFAPNNKTVIKDKNGDMWLVESKLIEVMRPMSEIELKRFEEGNIV
jgi:hypothetical protein